MKILMTTDTYLPRLGGGEYHVHYLLSELRAKGHAVTLLTTEPDPDDTALGIVRVPYKGLGSLVTIFRTLWTLSADADVIHSHYSYRLACIAAMVALLRRKPFVVTQHGLGLLPQAGATFLQEIPFRVWRWFSMKVSRVVISTSDDLSVDIRALGFGSKIMHIPNGYDAHRFKSLPPPPAPGTAPVLLTVRRLVPKNGIQYLVAALPQIINMYPDLRYICVGDGRLRGDIEALSRELGVDTHITFLGEMDHDHLIELYRQTHVLVIPSTAESTSLTCIEAMAMGKTIVASRVGGLVELLGSQEERGYLVPITPTEHCDYVAPMKIAPERIALLAEAIIRSIKDSVLSQEKAYAAATYAPLHFDWPVIAQQTEDVYGRVAASL